MKTVIVYSESGDYLVPVKTYKGFGWAKRYIKARPLGSFVVKVMWSATFYHWFVVNGEEWEWLSKSEVDSLNERLD